MTPPTSARTVTCPVPAAVAKPLELMVPTLSLKLNHVMDGVAMSESFASLASTVNGWVVALHRAMAARGKQADDSIRVCQAVFDAWLHKLPRFVLRATGALLLSAPVRGYFERQARRSQERRYAEDFVWRLERGPDGETSFVFDECAVNKWYEAQGVRELKPYCNFADVTYSRLMGMGVDATQTIGLGCDQCALRFKHGRETVVPPTLEGIVPDA